MTWWNYLFLVNIYLLLFYGFYTLLLRRETFFQLNRIYLVAAAMLSFVIPLIQSSWLKDLFITQKVQYTIYSSPVMFYQFKPIQDTPFTVGQLLVVIYLTGIVFLAARFTWQLILLKRVIDQPKSAEAFSFFKKISVGDDLSGQDIIAAHEHVHARQWHSADVLMMEAIMVINWFNPVVYLYRFAIKHIHEFIADQQAISSGTDKADYALLLLSQTFNTPAHRLVNPFFNQSLLKQRIVMLQKNKSQGAALIKYCLSAPLFVLMLILSSATINNSRPVRLFNTKAEQIFLTPAVASGNVLTNSAPSRKVMERRVIDKTPGKRDVVKRVYLVAVADTPRLNNAPIFTSVEQVPEFPGGMKAFADYLMRNLRYPAAARIKGVQGRVIISFVVEPDGELTDIHVGRGVEDDLDQEALRVVKMSPKWKPGTQNGRHVRVAYSIPISFALDGGKPNHPLENKTGAVDENQGSHDVSLASGSTKVAKSDAPTTIVLVKPKNNAANPIYIVDGKKVADISKINPEDIESISVLGDKSSMAQYGKKGKHGVVVITIKKPPVK